MSALFSMQTDPESAQLKKALQLVKATADHCNTVRQCGCHCE